MANIHTHTHSLATKCSKLRAKVVAIADESPPAAIPPSFLTRLL